MSTRGINRGSALLVVLALSAAGCSGGDADDSAGDPANEIATTTSAAATNDSTTTTAPDGPLERYAGYQSVNYTDPAHWLCRPDADDICESDLDATTIAADGTLTVEDPVLPVDDSDIDCFYVYPTISRDPTPFSDWTAADDEEGYAAFNQVARLSSLCRVFAPVYRQRTLSGLGAALGGGAAPTTVVGAEVVDPYLDVLDAWKTYMANDNGGRGVVFVGHSQGSSVLTRLIAEEIDPNPDVRAHLVAAYLAGSSVRVPEGADVGGDFGETPLCRAADQTGCVVTWASFRATAPPTPNALFGAPRTGDGVAACNSPANLAGGPADLTGYFPANRAASILAGARGPVPDGSGWLDATAGTVTTPFVSLPGLTTGECVSNSGRNYLQITVNGDPSGPRADDIGGDLTPEWGLHLVDISLVMGDMVKLITTQAGAWSAAR